MKGKLLYLFLCILVSAGLKAQSAKKTQTGVYEYLSAEYNSETGIITIGAKDVKGEFYSFHFSKNDKITNAEQLYVAPDQTSNSKKAVSKTELIGKKLQIVSVPVDEIDPANPYCCYRIQEVIFL